MLKLGAVTEIEVSVAVLEVPEVPEEVPEEEVPETLLEDSFEPQPAMAMHQAIPNTRSKEPTPGFTLDFICPFRSEAQTHN